MDIDRRADVLGSKLRTAAARRLRPFGVEGHEFTILPVVGRGELLEFEASHQVVVPEEYRAFLTRVSRGSAGPAYGLVPFEKTLWPELEPLPSRFLATPFRFETAFQPEDDPDDTADEIDDGKAAETSGTLVLCHEGCAYFHFLVCSGAARGQMWLDNTGSGGPYSPLGVGFFDWYERWLDDVLEGGRGTWWMHSPDDDDREFQDAIRKVKPWWRA